MKTLRGFALIELIVFIVVTAVLSATILLAFVNALQKTPILQQQTVAAETAQKCMEWFIGQRHVNGYSAVATGSTVPSFCSAPSGYTVAVNVAATTINSDSNFKTITVTVSGNGNAVLTTLIADY